MEVYKNCKKYLVTLRLHPDARTNIGRKNVLPEHTRTAKYRADKAFVVNIEWCYPDRHPSSDAPNSTRSRFNPDFVYKIGTWVSVPDFNKDLEKVCTTGIHFFLDKKVARDYWEKETPVNGTKTCYYENGQRRFQDLWKNDKINGICRNWAENETMTVEEGIEDNRRHGTYKEWLPDGTLISEEEYYHGALVKKIK